MSCPEEKNKKESALLADILKPIEECVRKFKKEDKKLLETISVCLLDGDWKKSN